MKSTLISIQPQWVEKILNGEKTIEIRKTMPKGKLPCKVYIYCTKVRKYFFHGCIGEPLDELYRIPNNARNDAGKIRFGYSGELMCCGVDYDESNFLNGKVVAEFALNKVECFTTDYRRDKQQIDRIIKDSCIDFETLEKYEYGKPCLYAWHIDDLKIYNKPKDLSEFESPKIDLSKEYGGSAVCPAYGRKKITRAPQSWCYVEELGAEE